jgi:hypothetical protein
MEYALTLAVLYPGMNYFWWHKLRPEIEQECKHESSSPIETIELYNDVDEFIPPIYVGSPNIGVPIGGSIYKKEQNIYSAFNTKDQIFRNYEFVGNKDYTTKFINSMEHFEKISKMYDIPTDAFPINFPIQIHTSTLSKGIYYNQKYGMAGHNKDILVKEILNKRCRLPFSTIIPLIAIGYLGYRWIYYGLDIIYNEYKPYYPPFHPKYKR